MGSRPFSVLRDPHQRKGARVRRAKQDKTRAIVAARCAPFYATHNDPDYDEYRCAFTLSLLFRLHSRYRPAANRTAWPFTTAWPLRCAMASNWSPMFTGRNGRQVSGVAPEDAVQSRGRRGLGHKMAAQGYVVIMQDTRGRFDSRASSIHSAMKVRTATTQWSGPRACLMPTARWGCSADRTWALRRC